METFAAISANPDMRNPDIRIGRLQPAVPRRERGDDGHDRQAQGKTLGEDVGDYMDKYK